MSEAEAAVETPVNGAAVVDSDAAMGAVFDRLVTNNGSDRDEGGQFSSPNGSDDGADQAKPNDQAKVETPAVVAGTPAPAHLTTALKAQWDKMPEEARAEVARLTGDWDRKFGDLGKQLQQVKPIADKLTEAVAKFPDFKGFTPERIAQGAIELAAVQVALGRDPINTLVQIAEHYKVLPQLAQKLTSGGASDQSQVVTGLRQEIANLKADLQKAANPDTIRDTVSTTLDQRMAEKEAEASLKNWMKDQPFYADVEADLPHFVAKVIEKKGLERPHADILSDAYDMAINANPEVRAKVRAAEAKATDAKTDPKRAADVRNAISVNVKSSSSGKERARSEEEAMGEAYDRLMARH